MAKVKSAGAPAKAAEPVKESQILPAREASLFKQLVVRMSMHRWCVDHGDMHVDLAHSRDVLQRCGYSKPV